MWTINEQELEMRRAEWENDRKIIEQVLGERKAGEVVACIYNLKPDSSKSVKVGNLTVRRIGMDSIYGDEYQTKRARILVTHAGSGFSLNYLEECNIELNWRLLFQEWLWSGLATLLFCFDRFYGDANYYGHHNSREMRCALRNPLMLSFKGRFYVS